MFDAKQGSVSRRGFLGFAGVAAAGLAGATALSGCSPRTSGGKDSKSGEVAGISGVSGHEREGLPSFLIAPEPITDISETLDYDVVVVGAGSAGIPAALSACEAGAKVALLQKESTAISQGNTASGIITDKSNPAAAAALAQLLVKESAYRADPALIQVWIDNGGEAVKWVLDKVAAAGGSVIDQGNNQQSKASNEVNGYEGLNYVTSYMGPKPYSNGDGMKVLAQVAEEAGVDIYYSTPAEQLVKKTKTGPCPASSPRARTGICSSMPRKASSLPRAITKTTRRCRITTCPTCVISAASSPIRPAMAIR